MKKFFALTVCLGMAFAAFAADSAVQKSESPVIDMTAGHAINTASPRVKGEVPGIVMPEHWDVGRAEDFSLVLSDSYGDGWDGATMDVLVNAVLIHDDITVASGSVATFALSVDDGDFVETVYTAGSYESEHSYAFYDQLGNLVASDGPSPSAGISFTVGITSDLPGCTDPAAPNYNPDATIDDGSCCYSNWVSVTCGGGSWGGEVSWTLVDEFSTTVLEGGAPYLADACLEDGLYTLNAVDSYGDGWNGNVFTINTDNGPFTYTLDSGTHGTTTFALPLATCEPIACVGTAEVEPNDGPNGDGTVGVIMDGETICGTAFTWTETDTLGNVYNYRDTDWYQLDMASDAIITANLDVEEFDGTLILLAADQASVITSADAAGFCGDEVMVSECLPAGTYYVFAAHNDFTGVDVPANYGLSVSLEACTYTTPCDEFVATAITLPYAGTGTNVGAPDITGSTSGDVGYSFTLTEESTLSWETCLTGTGFDTDSYLFSGDPCNGGTQLVYNDGDSACSFAAWATGYTYDCGAPLPAGDYTLVISGYGTYTGSFALEVTATPTAEACACDPVVCTGTAEVEPNDGPNGDGTVGSIAEGEVICGNTYTWTETDSLGNVTNFRDTDWYEVLLVGDAELTIDLAVDDFNGILFLVADDLATIVASADAAAYCEAEQLLSGCVAAGSYYIVVAHNDFTGVDAGANYSLSYSSVTCTVPTCDNDTFDTAEVIGAFPYSYAGNTSLCVDDLGPFDVQPTQCLQGTYYTASGGAADAYFWFELASATELTFSLCGSSFDTAIGVFADTGVAPTTADIVAYNDDTCGLQSEVVCLMDPGAYYIVVDGYSTAAGDYTLNVTAAALPCDMPVNLAIAMVAGSAELSWDAVGTATSYDVYASTDGYGVYTLLGNSATNSYSDAGAQAAGRKFYKVVAVCP